MPFAVGLALALSAVTGNTVSASTIQTPPPQAQTVQEFVTSYFTDIPVMVDIARCESRFRQFDKQGNVLKNSTGSSAVGVFQIMSSVHAGIADKMEVDINTLDGNVVYARQLYQDQGTAPWNSSKACWGKSKAAQALAVNSK